MKEQMKALEEPDCQPNTDGSLSDPSDFGEREPFKPGDWWPRVSDEKEMDQDRFVCGRITSRRLKETDLKEVRDSRIAFRDSGARHMTLLMEDKLLDLAEAVATQDQEYWDGLVTNLKLFVKRCFIKNPDSGDNKLHHEGRLIHIRFESMPDTEEGRIKLMHKLAALCKQVGFGFIESTKDRLPGLDDIYIHAAVRPDHHLMGPWRTKTISVGDANDDLKNGWGRFIRKHFNPKKAEGVILVDGAESTNQPLRLLHPGREELKIGQALLNLAAQRGLYPKAYYPERRPCSATQPIIRLLPSPLQDLVAFSSPVKVESLETSLKIYSDAGENFCPKNTDSRGVPLADVLSELFGPDKRYSSLECRVHDDLKFITVVETCLHPCAGLTNILDALAYEVHGMWFWSGPARIDFVSRPYNLFLGSG